MRHSWISIKVFCSLGSTSQAGKHCEVRQLFSFLTSTQTCRRNEHIHGFRQRGTTVVNVSHAFHKDNGEKNRCSTTNTWCMHAQWAVFFFFLKKGWLQYAWQWTSNTGRTTRIKKKPCWYEHWWKDAGWQTADTEKESRMERANRKGQVLRDKQIVKDKAMRAGSVPLCWVASAPTSSETPSESQVFDCSGQQPSLVPVTAG